MCDVTSKTFADVQLGLVEAEVLQAEKIDCRAKHYGDRTRAARTNGAAKRPGALMARRQDRRSGIRFYPVNATRATRTMIALS